MRYLVLTSLLLFFYSADAQVFVENVNINELEEVVYCQVVATGKLFSNKVKINIDYGQHSKFLGKKNSTVNGPDGKAIKFNSLFAAINFMANNGWKFVHAYAVTLQNGMGGASNVYHYTFERDGAFKG